MRAKREAELQSLADKFERAKIADDPKTMPKDDGFVYMTKMQYRLLQAGYLRKKEKFVEKYGTKALTALEGAAEDAAEEVKNA